MPDYAPYGLHVAVHVASGHMCIYIASKEGYQTRIQHGYVAPGGQRLESSYFICDGRDLTWRRETIRATTQDGRTYDWTAAVVLPAHMPDPSRCGVRPIESIPSVGTG